MRDTKLLFEEQEEDFAPDADRAEPTLWVRRLVVVPDKSETAVPIRDIEFRRGLNIIATAEPKERIDGVVGHNVGKTLLTRLIRYCLGEQHFAREPVRDTIAERFPDAFVIAEVILNGRCWIVRRPIGAAHSSESGVLEADRWRAVLAYDAELSRLSTFVEMIEEATVRPFTETLLPHQARRVRWLDLLAWLSRDQYCRYRHPLQWRAAWTESGTVNLHEEDASVLIRLVMDLLNQDETRLITRHKKLLSDLRQQRAIVNRNEEQLSRTREFLQQRLKLDDEVLSDDLFGATAKSRAIAVKEEIQKALNELADKSGLSALQADLTQKQNEVIRQEQEFNIRQADRQMTEGELKKAETASDDEFADSFANLGHPCSLPVGKCPLKGPRQAGERNPLRDMEVQQKTVELQRLDQKLANLDAKRKESKLERDKAQLKLESKEREVRKAREQLESKLWSSNAMLSEADQYRQSQRSQQKELENLAKLERQLEDSREAHHAAHETLARKQQLLNVHFNRVLETLMANIMQGRIEIDMRGLRIKLGGRDSTPGEALTSETALSLDLACLSAGICGLGHLPRFIIHDSPREADLESHIYARLFDFIVELEKSFGKTQPSFQYIVTTTTQPPAEVATEPYVRLTLDARQKDGMLLKEQF